MLHQNVNDIKCKHPTLHTQHTFHADRVTPFVGTTAAATALGHLDRDEYIVDAIMAHRGNWKQLTSMQFLVHWHGYDSATDSWEPWRVLRSVAALHAYLRANNLAQYIPSKFRQVQGGE